MGFENFVLGLVENQTGKIELHDVVQPRREFAEKLVQIPVRGDRFGNFKKRLVLAMQTIHLSSREIDALHGAKIICR